MDGYRLGYLVKQNEHQRLTGDEGVSSRLRAANSITALIWLRSSPSNHSMMSSMLAPASKFSKMTETGIRVPRSTKAAYLSQNAFHRRALRPNQRWHEDDSLTPSYTRSPHAQRMEG